MTGIESDRRNDLGVGLVNMVPGSASLFEQGAELFELGDAHVFELGFVGGECRAIKCGEGFEASGGDVAVDNPAIAVAAGAFDILELFETIYEAGDVGDAVDHSPADFENGDAFGVFAAEDAEDVVGGLGELGGFKELGEGVGEDLAGEDQVEVGLLVGGGEGLFFADALG